MAKYSFRGIIPKEVLLIETFASSIIGYGLLVIGFT
jgi:hypothetical protein